MARLGPFKGGLASLNPSPEMLGIFKVNVTILRITVEYFFLLVSLSDYFLPLLFNLFRRRCLFLLFKLHALNLLS